jgi:hypothetical protein
MLNKKGMIAAEEIFGMLWFVFVAAIMVLIFYGISIQRVVVDSKEWEFPKAEIEGAKDLNFFLLRDHPQDSEKLVLDLVIESFLSGEEEDIYYEGLNTEVLDFLSKNYYGGQLIIIGEGYTYYDSYKYNNQKIPDNTCIRAYSETVLSYINEESDIVELTVKLFTYKRCDT